MKAKTRNCFAVATPGVESVVAAELRAMGIEPGEAEGGGVPFIADDRALFDANLRLRSATRVIVRVAVFRAKSFAELERHAKKISWSEFVGPGGRVSFRVTCRKSKLYHSGAVAQRLEESVTRAVRGVSTGRAEDDDSVESGPIPQLFIVRFERDECTISADSSGALLHRRGYRLAVAKAPIRENIAAACLLALGYDGSQPLIDPMCGSGTIAIEAATMARRIPPGINRSFACEKWPSFDGALAEDRRVEARAGILPTASAPILASDRDDGAVAAALANATRAGVAGDIAISKRAFSAIEAPARPGILLTNPPYGARVGEAAALRNLYASIGNVARQQLKGWRIAMISAERTLEGQAQLEFADVISFSNGGIRVRLIAT